MGADIELQWSRLPIAVKFRSGDKGSAVSKDKVLKRAADELALDERGGSGRSDESVVGHYDRRIVASIAETLAVGRNVESERSGRIVAESSRLKVVGLEQRVIGGPVDLDHAVGVQRVGGASRIKGEPAWSKAHVSNASRVGE